MKTVAATYKGIRCIAQCSSGYMTGSGIPSGFCILHPGRHYEGTNRKWLKGSEYGKQVKVEDADKHLMASGHSQPYRPAREASFSFFGSLRRSMRKAYKAGKVSRFAILAWINGQAFIAGQDRLKRNFEYAQDMAKREKRPAISFPI